MFYHIIIYSYSCSTDEFVNMNIFTPISRIIFVVLKSGAQTKTLSSSSQHHPCHIINIILFTISYSSPCHPLHNTILVSLSSSSRYCRFNIIILFTLSSLLHYRPLHIIFPFPLSSSSSISYYPNQQHRYLFQQY